MQPKNKDNFRGSERVRERNPSDCVIIADIRMHWRERERDRDEREKTKVSEKFFFKKKKGKVKKYYFNDIGKGLGIYCWGIFG
jgi:hypothetical protein